MKKITIISTLFVAILITAGFVYAKVARVNYIKEVLGINVNLGKKIINYHEYAGLQGDGIDVEIYKGNGKEYLRKIKNLNEYPSQKINTNNYKLKKWKLLSYACEDSLVIKEGINAIESMQNDNKKIRIK